MKNTKNVFMTGIVLAITLFASIDIVAMSRKVNPYLDKQSKELLSRAITRYSTREALSQLNFTEENKLKKYREIYFGDQPYTADEILDIVTK